MKALLTLFIITTSLFSVGATEWQFLNQFVLKKDQVAKVMWGDEESKKWISFRWTLYVNEGLVLLVNKNGFPTQHVLYKNIQLDSLIIQMIPDTINIADRVYMLFNFFDIKKDGEELKAYIDVSIKDPKNRVLVEFYDPNSIKGGIK